MIPRAASKQFLANEMTESNDRTQLGPRKSLQ